MELIPLLLGEFICQSNIKPLHPPFYKIKHITPLCSSRQNNPRTEVRNYIKTIKSTQQKHRTSVLLNIVSFILQPCMYQNKQYLLT